MKSNRLRWGVLGTARIADALVEAIRQTDNSDLVAVASRSLEQVQAWANERGVPMAFGSYAELLESDAIDAIYIPLPNAMHREWTISAAQHGKHILCEKPLAVSAHEVEEMIGAAEANGVQLMEAFMYRFHPQTALLKQLVTDGTIGEVKSIRANFGFYLDRPEDVRWSKELGGGAVLDVGSYCVNITRLLAGAEPIAVTARAVLAPTGIDESLSGTLEFAGGMLGAVSCSMRTGFGGDQSLVVSGTRGRINVANPFRMGDEPTTIIMDNLDKDGRGETIQAEGANEYQRMVEHFAGSVLSSSPVAYTPQNSLANLRVLDALRESARTGRAVTINS